MAGNDVADVISLSPGIGNNEILHPVGFFETIVVQNNGVPGISDFLGETNLPRFATTDQTPQTTTSTVITKYRMRGYYIAGSTYEFWITTDPTSANPSGNPLVNKSIDSVISQ